MGMNLQLGTKKLIVICEETQYSCIVVFVPLRNDCVAVGKSTLPTVIETCSVKQSKRLDNDPKDSVVA